MNAVFLEAIIAGTISGVIVIAFFIAIDVNRKAARATANGTWARPVERTTALKQLEEFMRPVANRLPALAAGQLREKLSRAGDPGSLTPAGFQSVRYGLGALLAIVGLTLGLILQLPLPPVIVAPVSGAILAVLGYMAPSVWLEYRISSRKQQIQRSLAEATDLLTLVVESGMSLDEGMLSITERFHNALGDEIGKVLREIRLGRPRMDALENMAEFRSRASCACRPPRCAGGSDRPRRSARPRRRRAWCSRWSAASSRCSGSCSSDPPSSRSSSRSTDEQSLRVARATELLR